MRLSESLVAGNRLYFDRYSINWMDNKPVLMQSTAHSDDLADMCRRWCRKDRNYVNVGRPNIIKQYNDKMEGRRPLRPNAIILSDRNHANGL